MENNEDMEVQAMESIKPVMAIVGRGNVGTHLAKAFNGIADVNLIDSRTLDNFPENCQIALICVKDDAIEGIAKQIEGKADIICHTSGSVGMNVLKSSYNHYGVVYPLQTFTKGTAIEYEKIPFFVEADNETTEKKLIEFVRNISDSVVSCDSEQRKSLHLASVFACNFTNALIGIAYEILEENNFDPKVLKPLIAKTINKLETLDPKDAQTGPAVRNDLIIISQHKNMLEKFPDYRQIYSLLTDVIINKREKNNVRES